jgi:hypothetical protein
MGAAAGAAGASIGGRAYRQPDIGEPRRGRRHELQGSVARECGGARRVAAAQTGATASERLAADLGNIDALRAAAHSDPTSPTSAAVRDLHESLGLTQKSSADDQIMAQSAQEESDAAYLRSASKYALLAGELGAGATLLGGIGQGDYDPNMLSGLY